jgi:hypothetical protein
MPWKTLPLLLALGACLPPADPPACGGTARDVAPDEAIGDARLTGDDVLALVVGSFTEEDRDAEPPTDVTIDVAEDGGRVVACEAETMELTLSSAATTGAATTASIDRVDVEVSVTLTSSDGRFDHETADAWFSVNSVAPDYAVAHYTLDGTALNGTFSGMDEVPVEVAIGPDGSSGLVGGGSPSGLAWPD